MQTYHSYGPRAYQEVDAAHFKGRDNAVNEVFSLLQSTEITTIYAMSGDGKTSLVQAGLFPCMRANGYFPIEIRFSEKQLNDSSFFDFNTDLQSTPFEFFVLSAIDEEVRKQNLDAYIAGELEIPMAVDDSSEKARQMIGHSLWWRLHTTDYSKDDAEFIPHRIKPILVFDQFEEVINNPQERQWTDNFFGFLAELVEDGLPERVKKVAQVVLGNENQWLQQHTYSLRFKMLFSLRKEYIGALDYWAAQQHYIPVMTRNRYCLLPLKTDMAQQIIEYREEQAGQKLSSEQHKQLLNLAQEKDGENKGLVSPLILSIALDEMLDPQMSRKLPKGNLDAKFFIYQFYLRQIQDIRNTCRPRVSDKHIRIVESALVDDSGRRRPYLPVEDERLSMIFPDERRNNLLKSLKDHHLVRLHKVHDQSRIELVHDRIADAVMERRGMRDRQRVQKRWILFSLLLAILLGVVSIQMAMHRPVLNEWADPFARLATIEHEGVWTTSDIFRSNGIGNIDEVLWNEGDHICFTNSGTLRKLTIDVDSEYVDVEIYNCPMLREIKFVGKQKHISASIVGSNLQSVYIGDSVQYIDPDLFVNQSDSLQIILSSGNPYLKLGYAYDWFGSAELGNPERLMLWKREGNYILYLQNYQVNNYSFISGNKTYGRESLCFPEEFKDSVIIFNSQELKNIRNQYEAYVYAGRDFKEFDVPKGKTILERGAFQNCDSLEYVNLNDIKDISYGAFFECWSLLNIDLSRVNTVQDYAFGECVSLEKIIFPKDSIELGYCSFADCWNLRNVVLPRLLKIPSTSLFSGCINLESVCLPDEIIATAWQNSMGYDSSPVDIYELLPSLFTYCPNLKHVEFSEHSHFNWREDSVLYYDDYPALLNFCTNPHWAAKDSSFYYEDGLLLRDDGSLIDACAGAFDHVGWHNNLNLPYYQRNKPNSRYYFYYPALTDTVMSLAPCGQGTVSVVNPLADIRQIHIPFANPHSIDIEFPPICNFDSMTIVVPWHCRDAYEAEPIWQKYGHIVEESWLATAWQIIKDDFSFFVGASKQIPLFGGQHNQPFMGIFSNPLAFWLYSLVIVFTLIYTILPIIKKDIPIDDVIRKALMGVVFVLICWYPLFWLALHRCAFYTDAPSYEDTILYVLPIVMFVSVTLSIVISQSDLVSQMWRKAKNYIWRFFA